jgi:hypothetical protein
VEKVLVSGAGTTEEKACILLTLRWLLFTFALSFEKRQTVECSSSFWLRQLSVQWTSDIRTSDIRTLAYRDTPKRVPAKVVLCYPRLLIRTLAYKDTKMLVPAVSLYPRFIILAAPIISNTYLTNCFRCDPPGRFSPTLHPPSLRLRGKSCRWPLPQTHSLRNHHPLPPHSGLS